MSRAVLVTTAVVVVLAGVAVAVVFCGDSAKAGGEQAQRQVIGRVVSNGFRLQVVAVREPSGDSADAATVTVAAFRRSRGAWRPVGGPLIVGDRSGWFWNVVTRPFGVHLLRLDRPGGEFPERVAVRLLISASIGPSSTFRFRTEDGRLVPVR